MFWVIFCVSVGGEDISTNGPVCEDISTNYKHIHMLFLKMCVSMWTRPDKYLNFPDEKVEFSAYEFNSLKWSVSCSLKFAAWHIVVRT